MNDHPIQRLWDMWVVLEVLLQEEPLGIHSLKGQTNPNGTYLMDILGTGIETNNGSNASEPEVKASPEKLWSNVTEFLEAKTRVSHLKPRVSRLQLALNDRKRSLMKRKATLNTYSQNP